MRRGKFLPRPILFESGLMGQYGQNTIFQTNGRKIGTR